MTGLALLAAALAAISAVRAPRLPARHLVLSSGSVEPTADRPNRLAGLRRWRTSPWLAAALATLATSQLIGGITGLVVGAAVGAGVHRWIRGAESGQSRRHRAELQRDLPLAVDLLVACVAAGRPPAAALVTVADAVRGVLGDRLRSVSGRLALGADPELVWRDLAADPILAPLGHTLARSARTGSSITAALARCAEDVRGQRRARAETVARSVGVRAAAPLGACFLPAFLLIGVVPTIVGSFDALTW